MYTCSECSGPQECTSCNPDLNRYLNNYGECLCETGMMELATGGCVA